LIADLPSIATMARPARIDLQSFQQELANRLASKTAAQVESSRLGLACGGERFLIRLGDAAEVIAVPPIAGVPLTQPWFLGLANIRGNLYSVVDFAGFIGRGAAVPHGGGAQSRLILFGPRAGDLKAALVVQGVLGLRNLAELTPAPPEAKAPAWYGQRWVDGEGGTWQEIELAQLVVDPAFLRVGL
jgi:twitching motility protein PilI